MRTSVRGVLALMSDGRVVAVNVGVPRVFEWLGKTWTSAIWKSPVEGRVPVHGVNAAGDDQADRSVHGGSDKALYAYAREDAVWWETRLARPVEPGSFGENLTLEGIDVTSALIGERWEIGEVVLEVSQPRVPCFKLGARMDDPDFPRRFAEAGRPGAYLRIVQEGEIEAGDAVRVTHRPAHGLTVGDVADVYQGRSDDVARLVAAPELAEGWRRWAEKKLRVAGAEPLAG